MNRVRAVVFSLLLSIFCVPTQALASTDHTDYVVVDLHAYHFLRSESTNENTYGLGWERTYDFSAWDVGIMKDSYGNWQPYIGATYILKRWNSFWVGPGLSFVYRHASPINPNVSGYRTVPLAVLTYEFDDASSASVVFVPPIKNKTKGVLLFQYKMAL